jgi:hypothetical protein
MTVLFLHTHGSVLLAIVIHASVMPGKEIAKISLPAAPEPPDWLRAVLVITVAVVIVAITRGRLRVSAPDDPQVKAVSVDRRSIKG